MGDLDYILLDKGQQVGDQEWIHWIVLDKGQQVGDLQWIVVDKDQQVEALDYRLYYICI